MPWSTRFDRVDTMASAALVSLADTEPSLLATLNIEQKRGNSVRLVVLLTARVA
jgi:hypothetical protein